MSCGQLPIGKSLHFLPHSSHQLVIAFGQCWQRLYRNCLRRSERLCKTSLIPWTTGEFPQNTNLKWHNMPVTGTVGSIVKLCYHVPLSMLYSWIIFLISAHQAISPYVIQTFKQLASEMLLLSSFILPSTLNLLQGAPSFAVAALTHLTAQL